MDDRDRADADTTDFESVVPEARDYYQDSPTRGEGLLEKAREAIGGVFGGGDDASRQTAVQDGDGADQVTEAGLTDYATSNYSPDEGHPPSAADIDDVSQHYG